MNKFSVLIVDDMQPLTALIANYLSSYKEFEVAGISLNGKDALEKLFLNNIDLVLLDISLPDISGFDVFEKIEKKTKVIFMTGFDYYETKAFEMGAVDYLIKPFSIDRFNAALDKFLAMKKEIAY